MSEQETRPISDHSFEKFLAEEKLMGARCESCQALFVPPRSLCRDCFGNNMAWEEMAGTGSLVGFTSITIGPSFMADEGHDRNNPYCAGAVELTESVRVVARIEGVPADNPQAIAVGTPMKVKFLHRDGTVGPATFLAFEPA